MANWETKTIKDIIGDIRDENYVLPVIQRPLVWTTEKMTLLFDTLLKGDSFSGIIVIKEEPNNNNQPLFHYRAFTPTGEFIASQEKITLDRTKYFVIDGQQRLQTFYIGLSGSFDNQDLYFDLFSDGNDEYVFEFAKEQSKLPKENKERDNQDTFWYAVKDLFVLFKECGEDFNTVIDTIIEQNQLFDFGKQKQVRHNLTAFYSQIFTNYSLGISIVNINKNLPESTNRQHIVELFRRLNDGGTKLSAFDLVASKLKGFDWQMESFLNELLKDYGNIGLNQDNLIKLIFLLNDDYKKEMTDITEQDANFAITNKERIQNTMNAVIAFLKKSSMLFYYNDGKKSFIPLFFIAYHLFHQNHSDDELKRYFDNHDTNNKDFMLIKEWLYHSLLNGVFKSRGAGWVSYTTGIRKLLTKIKDHKGKSFPKDELLAVYKNHPLPNFTTDYNADNIRYLDNVFLYHLIYQDKINDRTNDVDHIMPKSILKEQGIELEWINHIANYQLLDYKTNRGLKNAKPLKEWLSECVENKQEYLVTHLIPNDESLLSEQHYRAFLMARSQLLLDKIKAYF